jgi:hypothetical protein
MSILLMTNIIEVHHRDNSKPIEHALPGHWMSRSFNSGLTSAEVKEQDCFKCIANITFYNHCENLVNQWNST